MYLDMQLNVFIHNVLPSSKDTSMSAEPPAQQKKDTWREAGKPYFFTDGGQER
jgi:hypothetical protein